MRLERTKCERGGAPLVLVICEVACAVERALLHCTNKRAKRRAVREAILSTLHRSGVITRIRDGREEGRA